MTPKQEAALIGLVAELAGHRIQKMYSQAQGQTALVRHDINREANRLRELLADLTVVEERGQASE